MMVGMKKLTLGLAFLLGLSCLEGQQEPIKNNLEAKIVQDADRLDAIGAIGIARAFAYGGMVGHALHEPGVQPVLHQSKEAYLSSVGSSINHFYEKLLLLKDRLNTTTARQIAGERHIFMEQFLDRFFVEWEGNK